MTSIISNDRRFETIEGKTTQTVLPPLYTGSTVLFENFEDFTRAGKGEYQGIVYGTDRLPPQRAFEDAMQKLEGSALTRTFQSGISAIIHTLLAFTKSGDHILVCDNVYGPTARFCRTVLTRYNVTTEFIPPDCGSNITEFIRPETKLIFLESPGSNTFEIQDIQAITEIASQNNIVTVLDNTWATPLYLSPFDHGIDVSIHSVTKYIGGHSDLLLGTVSVNDRYAEEFETFYQVMESFASPQDCLLALRGLKTLHVRLAHHEQAALTIARRLEQHPLVEKILHPALPSHPQHHLWKRDFTGSSGVFSFLFKKEYEEEEISAFVDHLSLFGLGYSWGGFKSLITIGDQRRNLASEYAGRSIVRLNIGLEAPEDLIDDLENSFRILENL